MASLVLGIAGAAIGSAFGPLGASIGWALGAAAGSWLDPQKVSGPRLDNLKLQTSQYGQMIPIVYGTDRTATQVIWQTELHEHEHKSGGKGSGPEVTTYTYSASFAVLLTDHEIGGVISVYADGKLVYDARSGASGNFPFTLYLGTETQLPDPTMEAELGTGNVPAYRGLSYMVFDELDLGPYGNRLPNLSAVVTTSASDVIRRLTDWPDEIYVTGGELQNYACSFDGDKIILGRMNGRDPQAGNSGYSFRYGSGFDYILDYYTPQGTYLGQMLYPALPANEYTNHVTASGTMLKCKNIPGLGFAHCNEDAYEWPGFAGLHNWGRFFYLTEYVGTGAAPGISEKYCTAVWVASWNGSHAYTLGDADDYGDNTPARGGATLYRIAPSASTPDFSVAFNPGAPYPYDSGSQYTISIDDDGTLWICGESKLWHYEDTGSTFNLLSYQVLTYPTYSDVPRNAMFCNGKMAYRTNYGGQWYVEVMDISAGVPGDILADIPYATPGAPSGNVADWVWSIGDGLAWVQDGLLSICGQVGGTILLSDIVADLSDRAGLDTTEYDVSELEIPVKGYKLDRQMMARSAIEPLRYAYYFDGVESDAMAKFPVRGKGPVLEIAVDDLAARRYENDGPEPAILRTRGQEADLPKAVSITYEDPDSDYQTGNYTEQRQSGLATQKLTLELAIVLDQQKAKEIAATQLFAAWIERDRGKIQLAQQHAHLDPCDVVTIDGWAYRLDTTDDEPYGVIKADIVRNIPSSWGVGPSTTESGANADTTPPQTVTPTTMTVLQMYDLPYQEDVRRDDVYWAAMTGADGTAWPGAVYFKSIDSGTTYEQIGSSSAPDTLGLTTTALQEFRGGNVFDETNRVTVQLAKGSGELASTTRELALTGMNRCMIGSEEIWFRDADLVTTNTYTLSGLLRGRSGTEWAMRSHYVGEEFVLLPLTAMITAIRTEYGTTNLWKAVTKGGALATALSTSFRSSAVPLLPLSPVHLGAGQNAAGDWILRWKRRTRFDGEWRDYVDVPLNEASEQYRVTLWYDQTYSLSWATLETNTTELTVTADQQTAIFGSPQAQLYWSVAQLGAIGPGYDSLGKTPLITYAVPPTAEPPTDSGIGTVPIGTEWHHDYIFSNTGGTNAELNFNYMQNNYGSSWAFAYASATFSSLRDEIIADLGSVGVQILQTIAGAANYAPSGFLVPWGIEIVGGSIGVGTPVVTPALQGYVSGGRRILIALPYPDNDEVA